MSALIRSLLLVGTALLLVFGPSLGSAEARSRKVSRADLSADRQLAGVRQQRDRGQLEEAMKVIIALIAERPDDVEANRFYMELAATSRRNGGLVEAEYLHRLTKNEGDSMASVLYAAAVLTSELTSGEPLRESRVGVIEKRLAVAEADSRTALWSYLVGVDLGKLRRSLSVVKERLALAVKLAPNHPSVRVERIQLEVLEERLDDAATLCLDLLDSTPWRAEGCSAVMGDSGSGALPSDALQEKIQVKLDAIEKRNGKDSVVLQALASLYREIDDRKATRRLETRLKELATDWSPRLRRNPYLTPLDGGELSDEELASLKQLRNLAEQSGDDPWELVKALQALDSEMSSSNRVRAMYLRQKAYALRAPEVLDRDGSRAAVRQAMEAMPGEPHIMNEWAYMSAMDKVDLVEALETIDKALETLLGESFRLLELKPGESFDEWEEDRSESVGAFIDTRGWLLYQLERHEEAERVLELASLLSSDGTVQGHLGRARYAVGNDDGAFHNLLRALALGTEETDEVRDLASHLYEKRHVISGGLEQLVEETRRQLGIERNLDGGDSGPTVPSGREGSRLEKQPDSRLGHR